MRIGIATGPVVIGLGQDGDAGAVRMAVGETPNLAARVQSLAEPDQVVVLASGELWLADSPSGAVFVSVWPMAPPKDRSRPRRNHVWPEDPKEFGKAVRRAREDAHLTREAFVAQAHISHFTLRNVETGRHRCTLPTRRKIIAQFERFGISPRPPQP